MKSEPPSSVRPQAGRRHLRVLVTALRAVTLSAATQTRVSGEEVLHLRSTGLNTAGIWLLDPGPGRLLLAGPWTVRPLNEKVHRGTSALTPTQPPSHHWRSARGPRLRPQIRCPRPPQSRPGNGRKSLKGETGSPAFSSQREDGEPEESVRGASRSDSVGKQVMSAG
ncbi:Hypothetical predicted protein [Marmota monax]|uniref:Uncharacterized protein n=1 Tax=Marmota monax TaxID=9995 RepID=A0A5E4A3U1_MARMO|nr:hypothetical protein GHT09_019680 [Marmota monax]VTJ51586.1 Hypothetical predicted protein [Marmota monax]